MQIKKQPFRSAYEFSQIRNLILRKIAIFGIVPLPNENSKKCTANADCQYILWNYEYFSEVRSRNARG